MSVLKKKINKLIGTIVNKVASSTAQDTSNFGGMDYVYIPEVQELCRKTAAEGIVMLKNDNGVLPITEDRVVSVFGRVQNDWFYVGYGSGGDVNVPYKVSLMQGIRNCGKIKINEELAAVYEEYSKKCPIDEGYWAHWPMCHDEMPVTDELVKTASEKSDTAIIVIGRAAGEARENKLEKGSYYLTDDEIKLLDTVSAHFEKIVVLFNCGSIMDMSYFAENSDKFSSLLYVWQGGMESGNAVADVLCGDVSPCGKLSDTIPESYEAFPSSKDFGDKIFNCYTEDIYVGYRYFETFAKEKVLWPFGFGLSYTEFETTVESVSIKNGLIIINADVKNIGKYSGKQILQVYYESPFGQLAKPARCLGAYAKTDVIAPGESVSVSISLPIKSMASYDDEKLYSWVMEKGIYKIYLGDSVHSAKLCCEYEQEKNEIIERCSQTAAPVIPFNRMVGKPDGTYSFEPVPLAKYDLKKIILDNLPKETKYTGDLGYKLADVKSGKVTMEQFVAQLDNTELEAISRGDYAMDSPLGAPGNAGAFVGVLESLRNKGVPAIITTDGPSGIRLKAQSTLMPIGTLLASTWNTDLVTQLYEYTGKEMKRLGSDVLLAPGMNIHRNPLCGRNFEYFSEDPYLTGTMAAAFVNGVQSSGVSACPKHFACNNQEVNREKNDSRLSERALREIYLKGFEICIKTAKPKNIMTSYNKINGVWCHYQYETCTRILRKEWDYKGSVMTDWWMQPSKSPEFPSMRDQAYRVRAGVNVLMPGDKRTTKRKPDGTLLETLGKKDGITLGELQHNAAIVLGAAMDKLD